jgi:hypothetical protein
VHVAASARSVAMVRPMVGILPPPDCCDSSSLSGGIAFFMVGRLTRRWLLLVLVQGAWRNRGTVVRTMDAARRAPAKLRSDRARDTVTELRAVGRLATEEELATRTDIRLGSVGDGCVVLLGPTGDAAVELARRVLLAVAGVVDVRASTQDASVSPRGEAGSAGDLTLAATRVS